MNFLIALSVLLVLLVLLVLWTRGEPAAAALDSPVPLGSPRRSFTGRRADNIEGLHGLSETVLQVLHKCYRELPSGEGCCQPTCPAGRAPGSALVRKMASACWYRKAS